VLSEGLLAAVETALAGAFGTAFKIQSVAPAAGGCIHDSYCIGGQGVRCFLKTNAAKFADAFAAEADGLDALIAAGVRAPRPLAHGITPERAYLAMEYLDLGRAGDWTAMGRVLAALHRTSGERYGWRRDNYIGATPQHNGWHGDWAGFWRETRLLPQLALAKRNRLGSRLIDNGMRLADALARLFAGHAPQPSLLHGDLWSGNAGFAADGTAVLFDPAVYFGDRETDLAMTELFGGFPQSFYVAYAESWPLDAGFELRREIYNLYHVLNHANLFGGSYVEKADALTLHLLAQTRR
jgi:protein-ribulosamine 3-kinase